MQAMFSRPVPQTAAKLNAWVTAITCQWLMGPCKVNDVELYNGEIRPKQGVLVERCVEALVWCYEIIPHNIMILPAGCNLIHWGLNCETP